MSQIITTSFCDNFIDKLADYIEEHYLKTGKDLSRLAIMFGGRRPPLFLKRELAKRIGRSFYPPAFFTIDEFIHYVIRKKEIFHDAVDLNSCFLLYQLAKKVAPEILKGRETFAQFLPWTREILSFIDQLDLERIDDKTLLNIQSNAQIGYDVPQDINALLVHIVKLRQAYHQELKSKQVYSRGLQYFRASELIKDVTFEEFDQIIFGNFFYLNRCEQTIADDLYKRGKAVFMFQGDERKWPVFRRFSKRFDCVIREGEQPKTPQFSLKQHVGFDAHSQVGLVRSILKDIKDLSNTVIVLPNPDNIIPLLSEISADVDNFNISMGYPLKRSSLYSLFEFVFKAQLSRKKERYYAKDYLKVLRHPFIKNLNLGSNPTVTRILVHKIEEILTGKEKTEMSGSLFFVLKDIEALQEVYTLTIEILTRLRIETTQEELKEILKGVHHYFFKAWEDVENFSNFAQVLEESLDVLVHESFLKNYPLNLNIATKMIAIKEEFQLSDFKEEVFLQEEIFRIFESKISREIVAFVGSPLKGLQILGLFETRSLNFENVIVLDVNEGVLPRLSIYEPLIPREVMLSLNLDRLELEEEIQRYQFMRLISSAKNVHLVYQESKDKEKSRFVEELIWEEQKKNKKVDVLPVERAGFQVKVAPRKNVIVKTPEMVAFLRNHTYSASSINTYLRNPIDFYYSYVLGLREQEDMLAEPEARHVGTFIHELLEEAFKPFINKVPVIDAAFRNRFVRMFEERFNDTFGRSMKSDAFLLRSVIVERLNRFLDNEQTGIERNVEEILYLENRFADTIALPCGDIKFGYIVDRVDKMKDGTIMIVDYKTGGIDQMPKAIDRIERMEFSRESIFENVQSFQIPLYFHYLDKQFPDTPINAALYNLRTLKFNKFIDTKMKFSREQINAVFLKALDFILTEILDPKIGFEDVS
ncbi:hypothetical protein MNBD_UNCLBAC01-1265 [hydrothermal vent metagenome]|uniref:PD-(D/E)XK endonuclease-like domain-containing protein n=1 Tax=hydrothermal vent metagenome TaxID=652676 RepID=A0A3B1DD30_9ZZZZ